MLYARRCNPDITGQHDPLNHGTTNPFACSRDSSHWKSSQAHWSHYGIDIRQEADQPSTLYYQPVRLICYLASLVKIPTASLLNLKITDYMPVEAYAQKNFLAMPGTTLYRAYANNKKSCLLLSINNLSNL
jgi:hypothetical protein